jgi:hypothetical protein
MYRMLCALLFYVLLVSGCATPPPAPPDLMLEQLEAGEQITLRLPARLLHGHDMTEPSYDSPEGYKPIPAYQGELALTDRRLLFVSPTKNGPPAFLSIGYAAVARSRPSATPLLHYLVVWDTNGHAESFIVDRSQVAELHRDFAKAMDALTEGGGKPRHQ